MNNRYLFTSESVSEGHPDKLCDQISDAILDECLRKDPNSHVACETFASTALILVGGEITTETFVDVQQVARDIARDIGYTDADYGLDCDSMAVMNMIHAQSPDINQGVAGQGLAEYQGLQGAGDQGMMFGFACSETPELMPAPIMYAHNLLLKATKLRKEKTISWLRPDSKSQVTIQYENHKPVRIDTVVISHQHNPDVSYNTIKDTIVEQIIKPVLEPTGLLDADTKFFVNPTGRFVVGGPFGDTGLTGRKIIVDTYGGMGRHGGGCFSGKDPSKVDRSAAYMARYIAKNIVAAGLAERCEIQLAYAIGVPFPVSVMVDTFGTGKVEDFAITEAVKQVFDCSPAGIIKTLDLKKPIYRKTAAYGHFGRQDFSWEKTDKVEALKNAIK
ncbi:MAG: methionine adenosyltransferase [Candidatus Treponema excrementipullorum]|nr:methionine adenosyltransferase [Spirochaetia bacterium]MCI7589953.1 methionine adenosyltransferase [Spirochaetia bacterium]MDD7012884.1 methionine adenosyltransferase [Candidatus Treponema excrementipullorum]MDY4707206.1 methionine adenosyltransferase [Candidatus Treponema excrementipullorum]